MNDTNRICTICKLQKPLEAFIKDKRKELGHRFQCKACHNIRAARYISENPEKRAETKRASYKKHKVQIAEYSKIYYLNNKDVMLERGNIWAKANPEKIADKRNRRRANLANSKTYVISDAFIKRLYRSACVACGSTKNITQDHVIPIARGGTHGEGNLQPLCLSCNSGKMDKLWVEWLYASKPNYSNFN